MKVVIVDHPKILGFLENVLSYSKSKRRASLEKRQLGVQLPFLYFCSLYII